MESKLKRDSLVLLWFFLFVLVALDTRLIYEATEPAFYLRWDFVISSLSQPGGLASLVGALLGQLMASRVVGALSLTVLAGILLVLSDWVLKLFAGRRLPFVRYVPVMTFAAMTGTYAFALEAAPAVLILLLFAGMYMSLPNRSVPIRSGILAIMTALLYLATAGIPAVFRFHPSFILQVPFFLIGWALLCLGFEMHRILPAARSKTRLLLLVPAAAVVIGCLAGALSFQTDILWKWHGLLKSKTYVSLTAGTIFWQTVLTLAMYASVTTMAVLAFIIQIAQSRTSKPVKAPTTGKSPQLTGARRNGRTLQLLGTMATLGLLTGAMLLPRWTPKDGVVPSRVLERWLKIGYLVHKTQYEQALNEASKLSIGQFSPPVICDINLSLSETGRLLDELFVWANRAPQGWQMLNIQIESNYDFSSKEVNTLILLGRINDAEHLAYEIKTLYKQRPALLWQLALIHMVKDEPEMARIYLNALADNLFYRRRAIRYLDLLNRDPHLSDVGEIKRLRIRMMPEDDVEQTTVPLQSKRYKVKNLLIKPLEKDPSNRLALDYLFGEFLLQGNLSAVADNIYRLPAAGYKQLPLLVQEALLVHQYQGGRNVNMAGMKINPQVANDFQEFLNLDIIKNIKQLGSASNYSWQALEKFGGTYWFYFWFRLKKGELL